MFKCDICGKIFNTGNSYRTHRGNHSAKLNGSRKKFKLILVEKHCTICKNEFTVSRKINIATSEVVIDVAEKKYCSRKCSNSVGGKSTQGTKEINCKICGSLVVVKKKASHIICDKCRTIESVDYICKFCGKFLSKNNLAKHEYACKVNPNKNKVNRNKIHNKSNGYIYKITNIVNGKIYIGKKLGSPEHSKNYMGSGVAIRNAIKKYGKNNFSKEILEVIENGDLNDREVYWISEYNSFSDNGYNLTVGGDGGPLFLHKKHTVESKNKIRFSIKNHSRASSISAGLGS